MRTVVAKVITSTNTIGSIVQLNRIGSVTEAGITCSNLTLDILAGDYIKSLNIVYNSSVVTKIQLTTNNGTTLAVGKGLPGTTIKSFMFSVDWNLLGFWGTALQGQ